MVSTHNIWFEYLKYFSHILWNCRFLQQPPLIENKEESFGKDKVGRILTIYSKLMNGAIVNKAEEAANFAVNERSIQRDIDNIRNYLETECF